MRICTVGLLRPRVVVTDAVVRLLGPAELRATLAHELAHVARRDNLRRAAAEVACFMAPVALWWWFSLHLVVSSPEQFATVLGLGLLSGLLLRAVAVPALVYSQERRADEWAARVVGDRLVVAAALVKVGAALGRERGQPVDLAWASFAPYRHAVASRVRRLIDGDGRRFAALDRGLRHGLRVGAAAAALVLGLAVHRAESRGLGAQLGYSPCATLLAVRIQSPLRPGSARASAARVERVSFEVP